MDHYIPCIYSQYITDNSTWPGNAWTVRLLIKQPYSEKTCCDLLIWVTGHCNRAAVSRNRYGVEKTVYTHTILINAIQFYVCLQEI